MAIFAACASARGFAQGYPAGRTFGPPVAIAAGEGVLLGRVLMSPSAGVSWSYDSNVFDLDRGAEGDSVEIARARLGFKLPYLNSFASLNISPLYRRYGNASSPLSFASLIDFENRLNFSNGAIIDVKDSFLDAFSNLRQQNTRSGDYEFTSIPFHRNDAETSYDWAFANGYGVAGKLNRTDYVSGRTTGIDVINPGNSTEPAQQRLYNFFDYSTTALELRGYRALSRYQIFLSVSGGRTVQDRTRFNTSRNATGLNHETIDQGEVAGGIKGNILRNTAGEVQLGLTSWSFKRGDVPSFVGLAVSGELHQTIDRATSAVLRVERTPEQANGVVSGYYLFTRYGVGMDRKLTMRLLARAALDLLQDRFQGSGRTTSSSTSTQDRFKLNDYTANLELRYRAGSTVERPGPLELVVYLKQEHAISTLRSEATPATSTELAQPARRPLNIDKRTLGISLQYGWF